MNLEVKSICPVSKLPIYSCAEWENVDLGSGYYTTYRLIGRHILLTIPKGICSSREMEHHFAFRREVLRACGLAGKSYAEIRDYTESNATPSKDARMAFLEKMIDASRNGLLCFFGFNSSSFIRLVINLVSKTYGIGIPCGVVSSYRQAVIRARSVLVSSGIDTGQNNSQISWTNDEGTFSYSISWLNESVFFYKLAGCITAEAMEKLIVDYKSEIAKRETSVSHFRIADFTGLSLPIPVLRHKFTAFLKEIDKLHPSTGSFVIVHSLPFRIVLRMFMPLLTFHLVLVKNIDEALSIIKKSVQKKNKPLVKFRDNPDAYINELLTCINYLTMGSDAIKPAEVHEDHPFYEVISSLNIVRHDIEQLYKTDDFTGLPNSLALKAALSGMKNITLVFISVCDFDRHYEAFGGNLASDIIFTVSERLKYICAGCGDLYKLKISEFALVVTDQNFSG